MNFDASHQMRLTKIVCTIGPACWDVDKLVELSIGGMNVARLNFSHGKREDHKRLIDSVHEANAKTGKAVSILVDTRGAEIRTGDVQDPIEIAKGQEVMFSPTSIESPESGTQVIEVGYDGFASDVRETEVILIDNGNLSFDILEIRDDGTVHAKAKQEGSIGSRRHINLPGADIDLPSITDADWEDMDFATQHPVDFVALSFIRNRDEVVAARKFLQERNSDIRIVTKIETRQAIERLGEIVDVSDAVMVARGDLGAEVPFEHLPVIQHEIVTRCRDAGKPVIIATHMLESMKNHPIPTRAEVTDVAHAAVQQADSTMLSGETASGKHPLVVVEAMDRILRAAETRIARYTEHGVFTIRSEEDTNAQKAVELSRNSEAVSLVALSPTVAQHVSKFRPSVPILTPVDDEHEQRILQLSYGIYPILLPTENHTEDGVIHVAKEQQILTKGDPVIVVEKEGSKLITVS